MALTWSQQTLSALLGADGLAAGLADAVEEDVAGATGLEAAVVVGLALAVDATAGFDAADFLGTVEMDLRGGASSSESELISGGGPSESSSAGAGFFDGFDTDDAAGLAGGTAGADLAAAAGCEGLAGGTAGFEPGLVEAKKED